MKTLASLLAVVLLTGCTTMLPSGSKTDVSRWATYSEAQKDFTSIEPGKTTLAKLQEMGWILLMPRT